MPTVKSSYASNPMEASAIKALDNPSARDARLALRQSRKVAGSFIVGRNENQSGSRAYQTPQGRQGFATLVLQNFLGNKPKIVS